MAKRQLPKLTPVDFDPFAGDYEDERTLTDKMVKARKAHACFHCCGPIAAGETHRSRRGVVEDGGLMSWRWCAECCAAMLVQMEAEDGSGDDDEADDSDYDALLMAFENRCEIHKASAMGANGGGA